MGDLRGEVVGEGRFLRLIRRDGWEYVERTSPCRAVFIAAITDDGRLVMTLEHRIPVDARVVGFPAGLVGDEAGQEHESLEVAARRELIEEAGYEAKSIVLLTQGPPSAGITDELIAIMLATRLRRVGPGGGLEGESIEVCEVPFGEVDAWLRAKAAEGMLVDPKVYTALYLIGRVPKGTG